MPQEANGILFRHPQNLKKYHNQTCTISNEGDFPITTGMPPRLKVKSFIQ